MRNAFFSVLALTLFLSFSIGHCFAQSIRDLDLNGFKLGEPAAGVKEKLLSVNPNFEFFEVAIPASFAMRDLKSGDKFRALVAVARIDKSKKIEDKARYFEEKTDYSEYMLFSFADEKIWYVHGERVFGKNKFESRQTSENGLISKYGDKTALRFPYEFLWLFDEAGEVIPRPADGRIKINCPMANFLSIPVETALFSELHAPMNFNSDCHYAIQATLSQVPSSKHGEVKYVSGIDVTMVDLSPAKEKFIGKNEE
ncbi:MAG: hypothetical protein LBF41_02690 [Deltaproteobacteria bacterium]|nr:hypothetical protein [Deltaproteobacteria bacterium]